MPYSKKAKQALPSLADLILFPPPDTKDKPYICRCGAAFARRDLLTRHERIAHEQNNDNSTRSSLPRQTDAQVPNYSAQSPFGRPVPVHASPLLTAAILPWDAEGSCMGTGYQWSQQTQSEAAFRQPSQLVPPNGPDAGKPPCRVTSYESLLVWEPMYGL